MLYCYSCSRPALTGVPAAQVFSACVMSFAHGANDVANAVGPYAAVYNIWSNSGFQAKSKVPTWILVIGELRCRASLSTIASPPSCHHAIIMTQA